MFGRRVHFARCAGIGPAPMPLVLLHGWPGSFVEMHKVAPALADPASHGGDPADAFEVIVPSLPGFGYSTPTQPDMNFWKIADVWHELMTVDVPGAAAVGLHGQEGDLFRKVIGWSLLLLLIMCVLVYLQSTAVLSWMVP